MLFLILAGIALDAAGADGSSGVPMREIDAGEILAKVQEGEPVEYDHVIVKGDLDLSRERLQKNITSPIRIEESIFDGKINFNDAILEMPVDLSGSNFTRDVYFRGATFSSYANFGRTTFSTDACFLRADFSGDVYFGGATFSTDAYFGRAIFSSYANFGRADFSGDADFGGAIFSSYANFGRADFNGDVDFGRADFSEKAYFGLATFSGNTNFWRADLSRNASFEEATFGGNAYFWEAAFSGKTDFKEAEFNGNANFGRVTFSRNAYFDGATFSGNAYFGMATFSGNASFEGATFSRNTNFWRADLSGNTDFKEAEFNGNIEFGDARFENETSFYRILFKRPAYFENCYISSLNLTKAEYSRLHLRWDDIVSLHFDEAAYPALIKNYNTLGWYGDANDCYYDYRNAVRKNWQAASSPGFAARLSNLLDRLIDFGEWLLYGYGVKPSFPLAWCLGIILVFGLFFWQKRCLRKIMVEERIEDSKDSSDEVLVKTTARRAEVNALDPILFSLFTFTSGFTSFLHPSIEYKLERCVRWAILERVIGPFFLALVITAISKTYLIR